MGKVYAEERYQKIMNIARTSNLIDVATLSRLFGVTGATIRSDLRELESRNLVKRTHGGAIFNDINDEDFKAARDPSYISRIQQNTVFKQAIGDAVAELINEDDIIMLDDGSTTLQVAKKLPTSKKITVITNGLNICLELSKHNNINVIATGGILNKSDLSYNGRFAEEITRKLNANKAILGASGITIKNGITSPDEMKAGLKKAMIENSTELIIVADHTKLTRISLIPICTLEKVSTLVTDSQAPMEIVEIIRSMGVRVILA